MRKSIPPKTRLAPSMGEGKLPVLFLLEPAAHLLQAGLAQPWFSLRARAPRLHNPPSPNSCSPRVRLFIAAGCQAYIQACTDSSRKSNCYFSNILMEEHQQADLPGLMVGGRWGFVKGVMKRKSVIWVCAFNFFFL